MRRNVLHSPRLSELKKRRRKSVIRKILIVFFALLVLSAFFIYLARQERLNIDEIHITGNKVLETKAIKELVMKELSGYYLWFFPKTNFIIYPQNKIKAELRNKFPRIRDIFINDLNVKTLEIVLTERVAEYTWCGKEVPEKNDENQKCYFLDEDGYIFDEAPYFSGEVYFRFYGSAGINGENLLGSLFFEPNFKQLISFKDTIIKMKLKAVALSVLDNGDAEIFLSEGASPLIGPKIIFRTDADLENVAENLQAALTTEPLQTKLKTKYGALEYIDLRFGNKVYSKFE